VLSREFAGLVKDMAPVYVDNRGEPVIALTQHGKGAFVLVSSGWLFSNDGLDEADNLPLVMNVLSAAVADGTSGDARILFDEYHHGYGARETLWSVSPQTVKCGLVQVAAALLLPVFSLSRRLKAPVPLPDQQRTRAEYLTSLATLLQRAGATGVALKQAEREFRTHVLRRFGLPEDAHSAVIVAAFRERNPRLATRVKAALDRTEFLAAQGRPPLEEVLAAAQSLFELRKEAERIP